MMLDGVLKPGDALPSVRQVAAEYQLNPITVSRAYQELADEALVEKRRGLGMYVTEEASQETADANERERFLTEEWPLVLERIQRLGLPLEELLKPRTAEVSMNASRTTRSSPRATCARPTGNKLALDDTSFDIAAGRIVGLIGPNGAGKTTALKAILGLTPFEGELRVLGLDPRTQRDELMNEVCFIADVAVLPRWIRVREAIEFVAGVHPRFDRAKCERFLANTKLKPDMRVREMSKGMIVQLHLALVMAIDAKLLVLDEPTLGLDILYRKQFYQRLLEDYFDEEKTIIVTTHQVEEVEHILTDVMFIRDGKIVLDAPMDEVGERYAEVLVNADQADAARALKPHRRTRPALRQDDDAVRRRAAARSSPHSAKPAHPGLADLFVATMKGTYA